MGELLQKENEAKRGLQEMKKIIKKTLVWPMSEQKEKFLIEARKNQRLYLDILKRIQEQRVAEKEARVAEENARFAEEKARLAEEEARKALEIAMADLAEAEMDASRPPPSFQTKEVSKRPIPPTNPPPRLRSPRTIKIT